MSRLRDLTGMIFGRLRVLKRDPENTSKGQARWVVQCTCQDQKIFSVTGTSLISGNTQSCGCLQRERTSAARFLDLTGKVFGRLTVLRRAPNDTLRGNAQWVVRCSCEDQTEFVVSGSSLTSGNTKSCGCLQKERASESSIKWKTPEEQAVIRRYYHMKDRCYNPGCSDYPEWGGRGITICQDWLDHPENFVNWSLANGFSKEKTINRINNDGPYCQENCEWVSNSIQQNNKRNNINFEIDGETHTIGEWSVISGIDYQKLNRLYHTKPQKFMEEIVERTKYR